MALKLRLYFALFYVLEDCDIPICYGIYSDSQQVIEERNSLENKLFASTDVGFQTTIVNVLF